MLVRLFSKRCCDRNVGGQSASTPKQGQSETSTYLLKSCNWHTLYAPEVVERGRERLHCMPWIGKTRKGTVLSLVGSAIVILTVIFPSRAFLVEQHWKSERHSFGSTKSVITILNPNSWQRVTGSCQPFVIAPSSIRNSDNALLLSDPILGMSRKRKQGHSTYDDEDGEASRPNSSDSGVIDEESSELQYHGYTEKIDNFGCRALERYSKILKGRDFEWIRLEKEKDPSLSNITTPDDVLARIESALKEQSRLGPANLYLRDWKAIANVSASQTFSVAQFNTLAEGLSSGPNILKPFNVVNDKDNTGGDARSTGYGGFTSLPHAAATLDFTQRRWRLLEVILGSSSGSVGKAPLFDLIAMQEVDRFHGFFEPILRLFGYEGVFMPKKKSPCVRDGWYSDGCCLFWNKETFDLLSTRRVDFRPGNQFCLLSVLRCKPGRTSVVVAVTHLKAQQSEVNEKIRRKQTLQLLQAVDEEAQRITKMESVSTVPILVLGDFNSDPPIDLGFAGGGSAVGQVLKHRLVFSNSSCKTQSIEVQHFESAYDIKSAPATLFTTWKVRGTSETKRIIDYIFYSKGALECAAILDIPSAEAIEISKLPGLRYPSDHLLIAAKIKLLKGL